MDLKCIYMVKELSLIEWTLVTFLIVCISSCAYSSGEIQDCVDLGDNYRYVSESPQAIIYNRSDRSKCSGFYVVPPSVIAYAFNDEYIIAKSLIIDENTGRNVSNHYYYWIVAKTDSGLVEGPMDLATFLTEKTARDINLTMHDVN